MGDNSLYHTYSLLANLQHLVKMNKVKPKNYDVDLFRLVGQYRYSKCRTIKYVQRINNDMENSYYNKYELILYYISESIIRGSIVKPHTILHKDIKARLSEFTPKRLDKDKQLLKTINDTIQLGNIDDYFKINADGANILYSLIRDKEISLIFYLNYFKKFQQTSEKIAIMKNREFEHFENLVGVTFNYLKYLQN